MTIRLPPCSAPIYNYLRFLRRGGWTTTGQILAVVGGTTCVHKRLSELIRLGHVEKVSNPDNKRYRLYRAKTKP